MSQPRPEDTRALTDTGQFRDKVAVFDPAAVPMDTDNESAGMSTPKSETRDADRDQAATARREVPRLDPDRAVSMHDHAALAPQRNRMLAAMWTLIGAVLLGVAAAVVLPLGNL